mmetsp:Transcript_75197/g.196005  ORF Transcript_75197/g.196005 Transcript_75197/m.196005 type:complete len:335 (-) Transcript_75197:62-1066(-)
MPLSRTMSVLPRLLICKELTRLYFTMGSHRDSAAGAGMRTVQGRPADSSRLDGREQSSPESVPGRPTAGSTSNCTRTPQVRSSAFSSSLAARTLLPSQPASQAAEQGRSSSLGHSSQAPATSLQDAGIGTCVAAALAPASGTSVQWPSPSEGGLSASHPRAPQMTALREPSFTRLGGLEALPVDSFCPIAYIENLLDTNSSELPQKSAATLNKFAGAGHSMSSTTASSNIGIMSSDPVKLSIVLCRSNPIMQPCTKPCTTHQEMVKYVKKVTALTGSHFMEWRWSASTPSTSLLCLSRAQLPGFVPPLIPMPVLPYPMRLARSSLSWAASTLGR